MAEGGRETLPPKQWRGRAEEKKRKSNPRRRKRSDWKGPLLALLLRPKHLAELERDCVIGDPGRQLGQEPGIFLSLTFA